MLVNCRTDLASEAYSLWKQNEKSGAALQGVKVREESLNRVDVLSVEILNELGASALGKSIGRYYTLSLEKHFDRGSEFFPCAVNAVAEILTRCIPSNAFSFLVAALGNPDITPDALGPLSASSILVTRHLKQSLNSDFSAFNNLALCRTGVLGTTGLESAFQIKVLCEHIKPDCVIAVDALAGADISRLCSTIQISSTGIAPGSGVGNSREQLSFESLGVPVIAVGMPTVIDAASFSCEEKFKSMFVTPRDIDSCVRNAAKIIGYGINLAVHNNLSISDLDMLVS